MAVMAVDIGIEMRQLLRGLGEAAKRGRDMQPAWSSVGALLLKSVRDNFDSSGRPTPWQPLSVKSLLNIGGGARRARTARGRRAIAGHKILIGQSGLLINSINFVADRNGVVVGSNLIYAATHQYGRTTGRGAPIPARPYLVLQQEDESAINKVIANYLTEPLK